MRTRVGQLVLGCIALAGCSTAQGGTAAWRRVVLVELFTSQGCSSCPAADAFVRDLPALGLGRNKVVPLTFHVDYWDGLGWKDRFARPEFTARQEWYARSVRLRSPDGEDGLHGLYTPQLVIDGAVHLSGRRRQEAMREMERAAARPPLFELRPEVAARGQAIDVTVEIAGPTGADRERGGWRLIAALAARNARTPVVHGENAGETLEEAAIVRVLSDRIPVPGEPAAKAHVRLTKPADVDWSELDVVVFVQSDQTGAIATAVQLPAR